jgi:exopolysaccharide biosynthesis predicted pyruvyltransferase EpsI
LDDREYEVKKVCSMLASKEVIITDRLHCMVLCALVGTPCIALDNISAKISGVYTWINELSYIEVIETEDKIATALRNVLTDIDLEKMEKVFDTLSQAFVNYAKGIESEL